MRMVDNCLASWILTLGLILACATPLPAQAPRVSTVTPRGLTIGGTTRIEVRGENLPDRIGVFSPLAGTEVTRLPTATEGVQQFNIKIPQDAAADIVPLWFTGPNELVGPVLMAVDHLPQDAVPIDGTATPGTPYETPRALTSHISGNLPQKFPFRGIAGAAVDVEVLAQRLGSGLRPSLRVSDSRGKLLAIASPHRLFGQDARCRIEVPADGLFTVELRDLTYQNQDRQAFRLVVGALAPPVITAPLVVPRGPAASSLRLESVSHLAGGRGGPWQGYGKVILPSFHTAGVYAPLLHRHAVQRSASQPWPVGPAPRVRLGLEREFDEGLFRQLVTGGMAERKFPLAIQGVVQTEGEIDEYVLRVPDSRRLSLRVEAAELGSQLDTLVVVTDEAGGRELGRFDDASGSFDARGEIVVPAEVTSVKVRVSDMLGRGNAGLVYRLVAEDAASAPPAAKLSDSTLVVPAGGRLLSTLEIGPADGPPGELAAVGLPAGVTGEAVAVAPGRRTLIAWAADRSGGASGSAPQHPSSSPAPERSAPVGMMSLVLVSSGSSWQATEVLPAQHPASATNFWGWPVMVGADVSTSVEWAEFPDPSVPLVLGREYPVKISMQQQSGGESAAADPGEVEWELVTNRPAPDRAQQPPAPYLKLAGEPKSPARTQTIEFKLVVPPDLPEGAWDVAVLAKGVRVVQPTEGAVDSTTTTATGVLRYRVEAPLTVSIEQVLAVAGDGWVISGTLQRSVAAQPSPVEIFVEGLPIEINPGVWTSTPEASRFRVVVPAPSAGQGAEWTRSAQLRVKLGNFSRGFSYSELSSRVAAEAK